ncbi:MAG: helix-turn-helix domain-containing protein [Syntrophales bacterium]|jgi:phage repressor protein C with HTH and peptisase S24 domain|nr:helix-turn-helix domain-containing protein [Syntrophales bacterium]MCK9390296.1 helix-turn-helix domain-containing protein [Syntrophales bacterium]
MTASNEIGKRIKDLRKELGMTQEKFGKEIYRDKSIISKIENGEVELSTSIRQAICRTFDVREEWILRGVGEKTKASHNAALEELTVELVTRKVPHPDHEFVYIRQVNGKISAGGGLMPDNSADIKAAFRRDWIKKRGGNPDKMSLIKVSGDSMVPTLLSGDLVLVDHGRNSIASQGGIYAISIDNEIMIKRVQPVFPDGKLRVISDNKQYDSFEIAKDKVLINGKVIWFARDMER